MGHTKTPWYQLSGSDINISNTVGPHWAGPEHYICECKKANAEFIVRAVNNHDELIKACKDTLNIIASYQHIPAQSKACKILAQAIEQAEKET